MAYRGISGVSRQQQTGDCRSRTVAPKPPMFQIVLVMLAAGFVLARSAEALSPLSPGAYDLLNQRAVAGASQFFVYKDADSGFNHGFPSGFFGNAQQNIAINAACVDDPNARQDCSVNPNALDPVNGTVFQISFAPMLTGQFAGVGTSVE